MYQHDLDVPDQFLLGALELYMKKGFFPVWLDKNLSLEELLSLILMKSSNVWPDSPCRWAGDDSLKWMDATLLMIFMTLQ